jgi:hypothetical protein
MASLGSLQQGTHQTVIEGPGQTDRSVRAAVASGRPPDDLAALVQKIRDHAYRVTDADVDALRARYSEDELFEVIVAAAVGAAEHRLQRALAAVEGA